MEDKQQGIAGFFWDEFKKWITRGTFLVATAVVVTIWTPYADNAKEVWKSPERLDAIELGINEINKSIRSLSGEDRIVRQREGLSYVEEPVTQGENVILNLSLIHI